MVCRKASSGDIVDLWRWSPNSGRFEISTGCKMGNGIRIRYCRCGIHRRLGKALLVRLMTEWI